MGKVILYARSNTGLDDIQRQLDTLWANLLPDDQLVGSYRDISYGADYQPELSNALNHLRTGDVDVLMVCSRDRLARCPADLTYLDSKLQQLGVGLRFPLIPVHGSGFSG